MQTTRRKSPYADEAVRIVTMYGHATNQDVATSLRTKFPLVSDTTVHRLTQRLTDDGRLARAPITDDGCLLFDSNLVPHDHFVCQNCGGLRDIVIPPETRRDIEQTLQGCRITGQLMIHGSCHTCSREYHK